MSLSGALHNAASGLLANARSASIVSSNISNALSEGYGRRELMVSSNNVSLYGGVLTDGVLRHSDRVLLHERRLADSEAALHAELSHHASQIEASVGEPLSGDSLTALLNDFEASLISASSNSASELRLENAAQDAHRLVLKFNAIAEGIQNSRMAAEGRIEHDVETLNTSLSRVADLNQRISKLINTGQDTSALHDQRQKEIDEIAKIVPVRVVEKEREGVALYAMGGAVLLDGTPPVLGFTRANVIAPHTTLASGDLSGLTINGRPVNVASNGPLRGGSLQANFDIRDIHAVETQSHIDGLALDLAERFDSGGPDSTLVPGDAGLFTDDGLEATGANELGLAGRLTLNALVAPGSNGAWRLRDGLSAVAQGPVGNSALLSGMQAALEARTAATSTSLNTGTFSMSERVAQFSSTVADARVDLARDEEYSFGHLTSLKEQELAKGVDTDRELQDLMRVEQAYAANAQVVRVIDDLMKLLLNR